MSYHEIECPYCEHQYDLCHDEGAFYDENEPHEEECPECEKKYLVNSSLSWNFDAHRADCLNTGEHKWKKVYSGKLIEQHPQLAAREKCQECYSKREIAL